MIIMILNGKIEVKIPERQLSDFLAHELAEAILKLPKNEANRYYIEIVRES